MRGILYGIGVGPGDPELLTLKAVRLIRASAVCAVPGEDVEKTAAYQIASQAVPELKDKTLLPVFMPMVMDKEVQQRYHREGAEKIEAYLAQGVNVAFLTLGDPGVYSTFSYIISSSWWRRTAMRRCWWQASPHSVRRRRG